MRRPLWLFLALLLDASCGKASLDPLPLDVTLSASKTAVAPGETINFTAIAQGGDLIGLQMDYADMSAGDQYGTSGARTAQVTFHHAFVAAGTYVATVTVTDGLAGQKKASVSVRVASP